MGRINDFTWTLGGRIAGGGSKLCVGIMVTKIPDAIRTID